MKIEISTAKQYRLDEDYYPKMGLIKIEGRIYDLHSLPDNLTVKGDLILSSKNLTSLPEDLIVGVWLDLSNNNLTSLPKGLIVGGYLDLSNNNLTSLPGDLEVGGNLDLEKNNFPSDYEIPDTVRIGGEVYW